MIVQETGKIGDNFFLLAYIILLQSEVEVVFQKNSYNRGVTSIQSMWSILSTQCLVLGSDSVSKQKFPQSLNTLRISILFGGHR